MAFVSAVHMLPADVFQRSNFNDDKSQHDLRPVWFSINSDYHLLLHSMDIKIQSELVDYKIILQYICRAWVQAVSAYECRLVLPM